MISQLEYSEVEDYGKNFTTTLDMHIEIHVKYNTKVIEKMSNTDKLVMLTAFQPDLLLLERTIPEL